MIFGFLTDVHANASAARSIFENSHPAGLKVDQWWFLGDAVGYCVDVIPTLQLLRSKIPLERWLPGNHDAILLGRLREEINIVAEISHQDHRQQMEQNNPDLLEFLEETLRNGFRTRSASVDKAAIYLTHGSIPLTDHHGLFDDHKDNMIIYLYPFPNRNDIDYGHNTLERLPEDPDGRSVVLIHGNSHVPYARGIRRGCSRSELLPICYNGCHPIQLGEFSKLLIGPGSVGQPRNPDPEPHGAYGLLDTDRLLFYFARAVDEAGAEETRGKMLAQYASQMDSTAFKMDLYLTGAYPGHEFFETNWIWNRWTQYYRTSPCGWDPVV